MTTQIPTTELTITGMSCGHCVKAVEGALRAVPGVQAVTVDLAGGRATVQGDADTQTMLAAVSEEGYTAQVAGA
ncbi:heavy-metal-associated domain-containing protein [Deinococcus sp. KSM4-11]|uniref:CopZ family metallochaperone n=1 Tax=Deinococcus sp. KSM4-11 TaxID=2568654 RepID=UPI0010A53279|nr:heavy metal-associated domain-containing protein [Deinococcus sp. KSM4-11]THF84806.1 heavy-metal-associated domain-containing protein [Deinococcus sp. KSM4-11]